MKSSLWSICSGFRDVEVYFSALKFSWEVCIYVLGSRNYDVRYIQVTFVAGTGIGPEFSFNKIYRSPWPPDTPTNYGNSKKIQNFPLVSTTLQWRSCAFSSSVRSFCLNLNALIFIFETNENRMIRHTNRSHHDIVDLLRIKVEAVWEDRARQTKILKHRRITLFM